MIKYSLDDDFGLFEIIGRTIVAKNNLLELLGSSNSAYNLTVIAEDGGNLRTRHTISISIVSPEALQRPVPFATISLLGGIFAGALLVLFIFVIFVVIMRRRKRHQYPTQKSSDFNIPKNPGFGDWAIEVPSERNHSSGLTITGDSKSGHSEKKSFLKSLREHESNDSDRVADSGKGESEHESMSSSNTNPAINGKVQSNHNMHTIKSVMAHAKYGPHCVQERDFRHLRCTVSEGQGLTN